MVKIGFMDNKESKDPISNQCIICGKIRCEVDRHLPAKEKRARHKNVLANIIKMTPSRSLVEEEESISTIILLPVEDSGWR